MDKETRDGIDPESTGQREMISPSQEQMDIEITRQGNLMGTFPSDPQLDKELRRKAMLGRITVVETVCHQQFGEQSVVVDTRYTKQLTSSEQAYIRRYRVTDKFKPIDTGWIGKASLLVIKNELEPVLVQSTQEEKDEAAKKIVEVSNCASRLTRSVTPEQAEWYIYPGESMRVCPIDIKNVFIRCRHGEVKCTIAIFPE